MAIDWGDSTKRKAFREALQDVYRSDTALKIFVDEELNETLAEIAGGDNLREIVFNLVDWAKAPDRLDEVYQAFKALNPKHSKIRELEQQPLVSLTSNLTQDEWDALFQLFLPDDFADLQRAFQEGFKEALGIAFRQAQPKSNALVELTQIREVLESYDTSAQGTVLAVRFVECAIAELRRTSDRQGTDRNLTALEQWRDRIAQQHNVPQRSAELIKTASCHAYLLVALEDCGADVNVYPELHITGVEKPIPFGANPTTCAVDQVADHISEWIRLAEETPEIQQCEEEEVTLELFLPCRHLDEDVATTWMVKDKREDPVSLGIHRRFLVRSSDRIRDRQIQAALKRLWTELEACVAAKTACDKFHLQSDCPQSKGVLLALLKDGGALGLKFVAQLPTDPGKRADLLNDIIDAAIPIALWSSEITHASAAILKTEFDTLLDQACLTNFADLARQWRRQRMSESAKQIKLLCDRPDRLPKLPDPNREEDLLVAS